MHHEAARAVPRSDGRHERPVVEVGRAASGRDRRRSLGGRRRSCAATKPKKTAGADIVNGVTIDQMIAQTDRPGHPAAVAAAGRRGSRREFEQLRRGLQLRLHELDFLADADRPLPMEINPQVVFERLFGDGSTPEERARAAASDEQHSGFDHRQAGALQERRRRRRSTRARSSTSTTSARSSAAWRSPRRRRPRRRRIDVPYGVPDSLRRTHQAAVRSAGAGVPGRILRASRRCSMRAT